MMEEETSHIGAKVTCKYNGVKGTIISKLRRGYGIRWDDGNEETKSADFIWFDDPTLLLPNVHDLPDQAPARKKNFSLSQNSSMEKLAQDPDILTAEKKCNGRDLRHPCIQS